MEKTAEANRLDAMRRYFETGSTSQYVRAVPQKEARIIKKWEPVWKDGSAPDNYDPWLTGQQILLQEFRLQQQTSAPTAAHPAIQIAHTLIDGEKSYATLDEKTTQEITESLRQDKRREDRQLRITLQDIHVVEYELELIEKDGREVMRENEIPKRWALNDFIPKAKEQIKTGNDKPKELTHDLKPEQVPIQRQAIISALSDITIALQRCHSRGVAHCNITPYSIAMTGDYNLGWHGTLTSFDCAQEIGKPKQTPIFAQQPERHFRAPEQYRNEFSQATDVYGLCATTFTMLTLRTPPRQKTEIMDLSNGRAVRRFGPVQIDEAKKFIQQYAPLEIIAEGLNHDPEKRPSMDEIAKAFREYQRLLKL